MTIEQIEQEIIDEFQSSTIGWISMSTLLAARSPINDEKLKRMISS